MRVIRSFITVFPPLIGSDQKQWRFLLIEKQPQPPCTYERMHVLDSLKHFQPAVWIGTLAMACLVTALTTSAHASFAPVNLPGVSEFNGWDTLNNSRLNANNHGVGFPGAAAWASPITPNVVGSASNLDFDKVSGNGYVGTVSVYAPFTSTQYRIDNNAPISFDIGTVIFQIDLGPGDGLVAFDQAPTLNFNGGTQTLAADFTSTAVGNFAFTNFNNPAETGTTTIWQYQWDLSGEVANVTDFELLWNTHTHAQIYEIRTHIGDSYAQVIPEPASVLIVLGASTAMLTSRRSRRRTLSHTN